MAKYIPNPKWNAWRRAVSVYEHRMTYENYVALMNAQKDYGIYEQYVKGFLQLFKEGRISGIEVTHFNKYTSSF